MDEKIKELNLLLLYLAGWEEDSTKEPGKKVYRSWKGFLFEVLNELQDDEMIYQFKNGKSVIILDDGIKKAEKLKEKYL
ncbi:MAG: transposase [Candidatus Aminicenantes bacterium]|nr:transposase [Candidatus Aminicenantes bacterium]MCK5005212.1 transposase [Candidatus Aminicenantes bacterium]